MKYSNEIVNKNHDNHIITFKTIQRMCCNFANAHQFEQSNSKWDSRTGQTIHAKQNAMPVRALGAVIEHE